MEFKVEKEEWERREQIKEERGKREGKGEEEKVGLGDRHIDT